MVYGGGTVFAYSLVRKLAISVAFRPNRVKKLKFFLSARRPAAHFQLTQHLHLQCPTRASAGKYRSSKYGAK